MKKLYFIILFLLFITNITVFSEPYKLIFAADLIRHGDRTPTVDIPKDPHHWKEGNGELTATGMAQLYAVGKSLREFYIYKYHLLPKNYFTSTIYARSSDFDRTLMSAQSLLLGLYPLGTGPKLNKHYALPAGFQPIPIHTVAMKSDKILLPAAGNNKQFAQLLTQYVYSQSSWVDKEQQLYPKLKLWSEQTGFKLQHLQDIIPLGDALYIRKVHGIKPPPRMSQKDVDEIINLEQWALVNKFKPLPIGQFMGKDFWINLHNDMQSAADDKPTHFKYVLFSGHDSNILGLMSSMRLPLQAPPPYASDLRFELFKNSQKKFFVAVFYNGTEQQLPNCEKLCPMERFFKLVQSANNISLSLLKSR